MKYGSCVGIVGIMLVGCSSSSTPGPIVTGDKDAATTDSGGTHVTVDARAPHDAAKDVVAHGGDAGCVLPYLTAPALLPGLGGGIDIFGGKTGNGSQGWDPTDPGAFHYAPSEEQASAFVTAADIEALFCPGTGTITPSMPLAGETSESWEDVKVGIFYNASTSQVSDLVLQTGYAGTMTFTSADKSTQYVIKLDGTPIHKIVNNVDSPILIDWSDTTTLYPIGDELFDALRVTFAPSVPASQCVSGSCIFGVNGSAGGYLYFVPLNFAIYVQTTSGSTTENSAPVVLQMSNLAAQAPSPDGGAGDGGGPPDGASVTDGGSDAGPG